MVKCVDGYERLCHIRGKFTGRSKRENALSQGTWVLIGLRQWDADKDFASKASKTEKNVQKCDLLEIYSSSEREKLRVQEKIFQDVVIDGSNSDHSNDSDDEFKTNNAVEFKDQKTLEYQEIIAQGGKLSKLRTSSYESIYEDISDSDGDDDDDTATTARPTAPTPATSATAAATSATAPTSAYSQRQRQQPQLDEVDIDDI
jgi:hypothetical protein